MTESSKDVNFCDALAESNYAEIEQEYLNQWPEWAIDKAYGNYRIGAQLPTRDGRRIGNAHIVLVSDAVVDGSRNYSILTDAGTKLVMNNEELDEAFYPPKYVSDVRKVKYKFAPQPTFDPKTICCHRARNSNGWHHNEHCPNWVLVY